MQGHDLVLEAARQRQAQRLGEAAGRGQAEAGRPHEGEELQQIEGGEALDAQALGGRGPVAKDRARRATRRAASWGASSSTSPVVSSQAAPANPATSTGASGSRIEPALVVISLLS